MQREYYCTIRSPNTFNDTYIGHMYDMRGCLLLQLLLLELLLLLRQLSLSADDLLDGLRGPGHLWVRRVDKKVGG